MGITYRPEHTPDAQPLCSCGIPANNHRIREPRKRTAYFREYKRQDRLTNPTRDREYQRKWRKDHPEKHKVQKALFRNTHHRAIGIDGEGWTDKETGKHYYSYIAACSSTDCLGELYRPDGIRSEEIFEFLLNLPRRQGDVLVGFSLGYDITKWFENLRDSTIYLLNHPEYRQGKHGSRPVRHGEYLIDRMSSRFTLKKNGMRVTVWDIFRFFGKAFVQSLQDWKVGTEEDWERIQSMKDKRGDFQGIHEEEQAYCRSECMLLAQMAETLIRAHKDAGISLAQYYGPGSTASSMLKTMRAKDKKAVVPAEMAHAVEKAFFGGRFENSQIGLIPGVASYDIASAYPFAMTQLPCLHHGKWELVKNPKIQDIEDAVACCVHYHLSAYDGLKTHELRNPKYHRQYVDVVGKAAEVPWGPFPFRLKDGNILFPVTCEGGWLWKEEFLVGLKYWPNVEAKEAWILKQSCDCERPFSQAIANYYNKRLEWGKEGKGIAMKLGVNSCYGKLAQRIGSAPFQCIVTAGMITSKTRSMLLEGIGQNPEIVVSVATDGIQAKGEIKFSLPPFTGTEETAARLSTEKKRLYSLGDWEFKGVEDTFMIRPGMRFVPSNDEISSTAARGLGVRTLHKNKDYVLHCWNFAPMKDVYIQQPTLFMGCKSGIRANETARKALAKVKAGKLKFSDIGDEVYGAFTRDKLYGTWHRPEARCVSYNPLPKRPLVTADYHMLTWALGAEAGESTAYGKAAVSSIVQELRQVQNMMADQPDRVDVDSLEEVYAEEG